MCQLTNLELQTKKWSSKLESTRKTKQDRPCWKFWLLVKGQCKKSKSTGPGSKSMDIGPGRFRVSESGHGLGSRAADVILWRGLGRAWHADVEWWCHLMTSAWVLRHMEGAWRRYRRVVARQIPGRRVRARVSSYDHQILRPSRSGDDKAVLAARVAKIQSGSQEPSAARVRVPGAIVHALWRVRLPLEVRCLRFVHDMSWSTSVLLVSSGKGLMCTDLIGRGTDCLGLKIWTQ